MDKAEITVGGLYRVKHTSGTITAKVERITVTGSAYARTMPRWICTNMATGREIVIKSAGKFLSKAGV